MPAVKIMRFVTSAFVFAAIVFSAVGCEEHVVSETVAPSTGMRFSPRYSTTPTHNSGRTTAQPDLLQQTTNQIDRTINDVGDLLFGWTDDLLGQDTPQAQPAPTGPQARSFAPIWVRQGAATQ